VRLKEVWQRDYEAWSKRSLTGKRYVYFWVDGIVRHEAPWNRVGCKDPPLACRSKPLKLEAA
jgi:hypothetical protein